MAGTQANVAFGPTKLGDLVLFAPNLAEMYITTTRPSGPGAGAAAP